MPAANRYRPEIKSVKSHGRDPPTTYDGLYVINLGSMKKRFQVFCDQTTDGEGWIVFVRRNGDISVSFQRTWVEYKHGFEDLQHTTVYT